MKSGIVTQFFLTCLDHIYAPHDVVIDYSLIPSSRVIKTEVARSKKLVDSGVGI